MTTIANYFEQAQLSLAAYALNLQRGMSGAADTNYINALKAAGMSASQATEFANTYSVIDQSPENDPTGLSATVFQKGTQYSLAIRGTEGLFDRDFLEDILLATGGIARTQLISLYNYVQRLITPAGQSAIQVEDVAPDIDPITGYVNDPGGIRTTTSATGLGYLAGVSGMTVTGHSSGGHLAAAASYLFPTLIGATDTYNAPGFSLNYAEALLDQFPGSATAFPSTITNLVANAGTDIIAAVGTLPGTPERIFIEDQGVGIPGNHGIVPLTDSLALYNLFATLDPTLNTNPATAIPKLNNILKASSSNVLSRDTYDKSLENALDSLRTLFQQNYANNTADTRVTPTATDNRDDFYTRLYGLETYLKGTPFNVGTDTAPVYGLTVDSLVNKSLASLVTAAQSTDLATRYALYKLNPFTVNGTGLYEEINIDHSLDRYDSNTRTGNLTDEYLKDRAAFLYNKIIAGNRNNDANGSAWVQYAGVPQHFRDGADTSAYNLYLGPGAAVVDLPAPYMNHILFDDWTSNTLAGSDQWDRLYGMEGDDSLAGGRGNDYLEGGKGQDIYLYTSGDGSDTILDTDHLGQIIYDGTPLDGGKLTQTGDNTYRSADGKFIYTLVEGLGTPYTLGISGPDGNILVKDFANGNLGIDLTGADPLPDLIEWPALDPNGPNNSPDWTGLRNGTPYSDRFGGPDLVDLNGDGSNDIGNIQGTADAEIIHGLEGDDRIDSYGGADRLYGDSGNDTIYFYEPDPVGDAYADGGSGRDIIFGESNGNNHFVGGADDDSQDEGDLVISAAGDDILEGGAGDDLLMDYAGADILEGGAGDDYLYGHASVGMVETTWSIGPVLDVINGVQLIDNAYVFPAPVISDIFFTDFSPTSDNRGDVLLGGAGNDYLMGGPGDDLLDDKILCSAGLTARQSERMMDS